MKTPRRNVLDDRLTIKRRNKRTKNTSEPIPVDLIIEIFLRLPTKSVARFRFVSKLWSSIFRSPDFTELFMTRSRARPQLLFAFKKQGKFIFFSSPQRQNTDVNSSPIVCANELVSFPLHAECHDICGSVNGLVCLTDKRFIEIGNETVLVICNPTTGQSLRLPKLWTMRLLKSYFVYDPVDKQFKVLSMTSTNYGPDDEFDEYRILTLGAGNNLSWRMIECFLPPHYSSDRGICINGVLYYRASVDKSSRLCSMIVCFDVRSEKFSLMKIVADSIRVASKGNLINYNGKLGSIVCDKCGYVDGRNGRSGSIELWILEDAEKQEWSKRTYVLPHMWRNKLGINSLAFVGATRTNEIVFSPRIPMPFCVFYYNIDRKTITKVRIKGMEAFEGNTVYEFVNHVEDVKLM